MLLELNIENFAIIENMKIKFTKGLNVITGETGSGKSIIIDSLSLVLGARANKDIIKKGKDYSYIEAIFSIYNDSIKEDLKKVGIEVGDLLVISREIKRDTPSITRINNRVVTSNLLTKITAKLIDIFAQHESTSLMDSKNQKKLLDDFGDLEFKENLKILNNMVGTIKSLEEEYREKKSKETNKQREIDLLNYQINEIEMANLTEYDDEDLEEEFLKYDNMSETEEVLSETINILKSNFDSYNIEDLLDSLISRLNSILKYNENLKEENEELEDIRFRIKDISSNLEKYLESMNYDPQKVEYLRERLNLINSLKLKYGNTIEKIHVFLKESKERLNFLENFDKNLKEIESKIEKQREEAKEIAVKISNFRKNIAKEIEKKVSEEINELNIKNAKFKINFKEKELSYDGIDEVTFLLSSNLGEDFKELSKIASGGEMSRIMLGFKSIIANKDKIETLIFDEIDTGISGKTAQIVGQKIKKLSYDRQVIVISHLPQIVSLADSHFLIEKAVKDNKSTISTIKELDYESRVYELARLIGGFNITDNAINAARDMIRGGE